MRRDSESACDDAALGCGIRPADYAAHVVALAREWRRPRWPAVPALCIAHPSAFERRIAAMLNPEIDRRPLSGRTAAALGIALFTVMLAAASLRAAQAPPAALSGTVYDATGAVMPGVAITLQDPQQHTVQATTNAAGRFSFPGVGSGQYVLSAEIPGFRTLRDEFELKTASDWDRALTMPLGALQETINVRAARTAAEPAPARPTPIRVGGNVRAPRKTVDVKPLYPASMRAAGREGQVRLDATIGPDGSVTSVRVVGGQVHPDFAIAAADAVRQWQFTPTLLNGRPVEVVMTVTVTFSLSE
jgi:TonB family protein